MYGFLFLGHQVGGALAAMTGGLVHNWFGDYQVAFIAAGLTGLLAAGFSLGVRERGPAAPRPAPPWDTRATRSGDDRGRDRVYSR